MEADASLTAAEQLREIVTSVLELMGLDAAVGEMVEDEAVVRMMVSGPDAGCLAARRGAALSALQYLATLIVRRRTGEYVRFVLDADNFRSRQDEALASLARRIAEQVKETGQEAVLDPQNPYERRIVHQALIEDPAVETYSEGEEPERCVVISPLAVSAEEDEEPDAVAEDVAAEPAE